MDFIKEYLWENDIGRISALLVGVFLIIWVSNMVQSRTKGPGRSRKVLKEIQTLGQKYPCFSAAAIECQLRAFCEAYYYGWNAKDLSSVQPYCTESGYAQLDKRLRSEVGHEKIQFQEFIPPEWYRVLTPHVNRKPTVEALAGVVVPGEQKNSTIQWYSLFQMVYTESGEWKLHRMMLEDFDLQNAPDSDLHMEWLEKNALPDPAPSTLNPSPPELQDPSIRPKPQPNKSILFILLGCVAAIGIGAWLSHTMEQTRLSQAQLLESGVEISATVDSAVHDAEDDVYSLDYTFQVEGDPTKYHFQGNLVTGESAQLDGEAGKAAVDSGTVQVLYDPEDPNRNMPVKAATLNEGDYTVFIVVFIIGPIILGAYFLNLLRMQAQAGFRLFWFGWKARAAQYAKA